MLEKIDLSKKVDKSTFKQVVETEGARLAELQRECKAAGIPVMIVFEGMGAAGKGVQINRLIQALDPRGFAVYATNSSNEEEQMRPFLWRYWTKTPAKGRIAVYDRSWYSIVQRDRFDYPDKELDLEGAFQDILSFEKQLTDDGTVIIKDWKRNKEYDAYLKINEEMLERTDTEYAPWTIIESTDKDYAAMKILTTVADCLALALEERQDGGKASQKSKGKRKDERFHNGVLSGIDLSRSLTKEEYKKELASLQKRLEALHNELYRLRIPVVLGFEGVEKGLPRDQ